MKTINEQNEACNLPDCIPLPPLGVRGTRVPPSNVLATTAAVLFILATPPGSTWAESTAEPGSTAVHRGEALGDLVRRFELLERRLRENERQRLKILIAADDIDFRQLLAKFIREAWPVEIFT